MGSPRRAYNMRMTRVNDGIPRTANFCGWLRNEKKQESKPAKESIQEREVLNDVWRVNRVM